MTEVFFSYSRDDLEVSRELSGHIEAAGATVWLDRQLHGGDEWWAAILDQIRRCDAFVFVLSTSSVDSEACGLEIGYAAALKKQVVPVIVDDVDVRLAPDPIPARQVSQYRRGDVAMALPIIGGINQAVSSALPDPLPPEPPAPGSYLHGLSAEIRSNEELTLDEQAVLMERLRGALKAGQHDSEVLDLLARFRKRSDLRVGIAEQIDLLLKASPIDSSGRQADSPLAGEESDSGAAATDVVPAGTDQAGEVVDERESLPGLGVSYWITVAGLLAISIPLFLGVANLGWVWGGKWAGVQSEMGFLWEVFWAAIVLSAIAWVLAYALRGLRRHRRESSTPVWKQLLIAPFDPLRLARPKPAILSGYLLNFLLVWAFVALAFRWWFITQETVTVVVLGLTGAGILLYARADPSDHEESSTRRAWLLGSLVYASIPWWFVAGLAADSTYSNVSESLEAPAMATIGLLAGAIYGLVAALLLRRSESGGIDLSSVGLATLAGLVIGGVVFALGEVIFEEAGGTAGGLVALVVGLLGLMVLAQARGRRRTQA